MDRKPSLIPATSRLSIDAVRERLYASKIVSYAQGMDLLGAASRANNWGLKFGDMATIWRGGCIIRAAFLSRIKEAYDRNPNLTNLMLDEYFTKALLDSQANWRHAISTAATYGVAVPAFSASLAYSTATVRRICPPICSRPKATSSARTPTSAPTSRAFSTRNGCRKAAWLPRPTAPARTTVTENMPR